jgi:ribosomal protein S1
MTDTDSSVMSEAEEATQTLSLMEEFLNDPSLDYKSLKYGDVMDGVIMRIDRDEILVDIGSKSEGVVPTREFSSLSSDEKGALNIGDTILVTGLRDPRRRRCQQAGRHGQVDRHEAQPQSHRDQPPPQPADPLRAPGYAGTAR